MTRLRAWSQRAHWLLCLCLLSFAFASFCNAQDLADPLHATTAEKVATGDSSGPDGDAPHAKRCSDCHSHHGVALPVMPMFPALAPPSSRPVTSQSTPRSASSTRELRPPIA